MAGKGQMITELLFTTDYGLIAVAATLVGLLLPLGFHLFIRRKIRESEAEQARALAGDSFLEPGAVAAPRAGPAAEN